MVESIEEQARSFFVSTGLVASIDAVAEVDTAPIPGGSCRRSLVWVNADTRGIVDRSDDYFAIGSTQQLQSSTAAIDCNGGAPDAYTRTPHLDDRASIDHDIDIARNIECGSICKGLAKSIEPDFVGPTGRVTQDTDGDRTCAAGISIGYRCSFGDRARDGIER